MEKSTSPREGFSSGLAVFLAALGSAVGLGNIWKFPYLTGANGGGAFLFVYFICVLFVGIPVLLCEWYVGRYTRRNAVGAFESLKPGSAWKGIGVMGVLASYLIMFFYTCVAGWVYFYCFKAFTGSFASVTANTVEELFGQVIGVGTAGKSFFSKDVLSPIFWQVIVLCVVGTGISMGVRSGIERITKTLMPLLFMLIIICDIRALTLPGAGEGIRFLFHIDFSQITPAVVLSALGLAFFKLSLAMGVMITYGSYFTEDVHLFKTAGKIAFSDTLVSMLAGIAIFPTVFSFGMEPSAGPGLLFMTIPLVFSKMPLGAFLLAAFFLLTSFAATTALLSLMEVPVAFWTEEFNISRKKATFLNCLFIGLVGVTAALSVDSSSLLGGYKLWGRGFFDFFDHLSSNIIMPLGGLLIAIFVGYFAKKDDVACELSNHGSLQNDTYVSFFNFVIRYVSPALLVIIFLNTIGVISF
ncbi:MULTISPECIES: sodium-dependent transporter [Aminobacterium]|uniref:Transporter n=1 Tax=Aminobacterium colombiense (strain DSM 12261 / ALA-1) TaxID=572547 RepID=D5ED51_AMICL|nr:MULTISPECIES: sodium-dependent transporter [Aminobacterium]MDD2378777.1 sodium-dependent transporter [Aminobacterium colombiense]ADE56483.1 sodium:neurotransmitter symporter [Aminobacterium colombiense DSM 12261]MDD3767343.1 sodium-dependent transporter [Aminobacterium colombiense]MDD4265154.1 sodium-dependent transporter [Aminobacterium colombiense]MDD4585360.1 sodium-dependent transporter [Aminobacterium colombiense]